MQVAHSIKARMANSPAIRFDATAHNPPLLVILDRCEDYITPLLTSWTYQAMLHQLLGMKDNRVDLSGIAGARDELAHVAVSSTQDDFYATHMYSDFGELGVAVKEFVDRFKEASKLVHAKLETIEDIEKFIVKYPDFRETSASVSKHVALVSAIQEAVRTRKLLAVSRVEQMLACHDNHDEAWGAICDVIGMSSGEKIHKGDALRLGLLYALRYMHHPAHHIEQLIDLLLQVYAIPERDLGVIKLFRQWCAPQKRTTSLTTNSWLSRVSTQIKRGVIGVDDEGTNMYMEYQPLIKQLAAQLREDALDVTAYPYIVGKHSSRIPTNVIFFIVGGVTYEEAAAINAIRVDDDFSYIVGGTGMVSPDGLLSDVLGTAAH